MGVDRVDYGRQAIEHASDGGEGGIRTPDTVPRIPVFKTGAINRSATSPTTTVLLQFRRNQLIALVVQSGFQDHPFQPLTHPSAADLSLLAHEARVTSPQLLPSSSDESNKNNGRSRPLQT